MATAQLTFRVIVLKALELLCYDYNTVDGQIKWTVGQVGSWIFLVEVDFDMVILVVGIGPIVFAAPWRFRTLDS